MSEVFIEADLPERLRRGENLLRDLLRLVRRATSSLASSANLAVRPVVHAGLTDVADALDRLPCPSEVAVLVGELERREANSETFFAGRFMKRGSERESELHVVRMWLDLLSRGIEHPELLALVREVIEEAVAGPLSEEWAAVATQVLEHLPAYPVPVDRPSG